MKYFQIQLLLRERDKLLEKEIQRKSPKGEDKPHQEPGRSSVNSPDISPSSTKHKTEKEDQRNSKILQEKPRDTQSKPTEMDSNLIKKICPSRQIPSEDNDQCF